MNLFYKYVILRDSTQNQYKFFLLQAAPLIHIDCFAVRCYVLLETIDVTELLPERLKNVSFHQSCEQNENNSDMKLLCAGFSLRHR